MKGCWVWVQGRTEEGSCTQHDRLTCSHLLWRCSQGCGPAPIPLSIATHTPQHPPFCCHVPAEGVLSSVCWGLAELPSPDQCQLQDTAAPGSSCPCSACAWWYSWPHVPISILQLNLRDQATSRDTQPQQQGWQPLPHAHCCVPSSLAGFMGFLPHGQFPIGTGYLIATNRTCLSLAR